MKESDWKTFKKIKEIAIEKFCNGVLDESQEVISDQSEHAHNKYLSLYDLLQKRNKKMAILFDGHSRSNAAMQLIGIRSNGLADEAFICQLSEEFKERTDPQRLGLGL
ncbi:MAG: hypothetical protein V7731_16360 [Amphritea sp.]